MARQKCFKVGRVTVYLRGKTWYFRYTDQGRRSQKRATADRDASRQLAAQVNAQLEVGAPVATSFEPITVEALRQRWLDHHEQVRRSSVATIDRYRSASAHLLNFIRDVERVRQASHFTGANAEAFVRYLRQLKVTPNGHAKTAKRHLRDNGVKYVLEVSRTLFAFALKRRHLPPYSDNPFAAIQIDRIPVEDAKPITIFTTEQEKKFLEACDDWQRPIFATLMLTGLRPGELTHLLLPDDLDLAGGWLVVRNKADLGWQVKTRNERRVPLAPELVELLRIAVAGRQTGPLFQRRGSAAGSACELSKLTIEQLRTELIQRKEKQKAAGATMTRHQQRRIARRLWVEIGVIPETRLRVEFMKLTTAIGMPHVTTPKSLRHLFATHLQEVNMDPLIRYQLMGHSVGGSSGPLGMTGVYSHASPATIQRQLELATQNRPAIAVLREWLEARRHRMAQVQPTESQ